MAELSPRLARAMMDLSSWLIAALLISDRADGLWHSSLDSLREVLHTGVGV